MTLIQELKNIHDYDPFTLHQVRDLWPLLLIFILTPVVLMGMFHGHKVDIASYDDPYIHTEKWEDGLPDYYEPERPYGNYAWWKDPEHPIHKKDS